VIVHDISDVAEPGWYSCPIDRKTLKQLMKRSDTKGLADFGLWIALLFFAGYLAFRSWGTWWAVPAFLLFGTIYSSSEARAHELGHGTPFKTRWLNETFYHLCSFMCLREAYYGRWRHAVHHSHTIEVEVDPEIQVKSPADLLRILLDFVYLESGFNELKSITLHAFGRLTPATQGFVPQVEQIKMIWSSRIYLALIGAVALWSVAIGSFLPMMFVALPRFYGGWLHQIGGLTQHAGLPENVRDHRRNTRTVLLNPVFSFLYFNLNYHVEHHLFPMVAFHSLPKLHEEIRRYLPYTYKGVFDVYREIVPALIRQSGDRDYFVHRDLPEAQEGCANLADGKRTRGVAKQNVNGGEIRGQRGRSKSRPVAGM
jgi:fatty acid desaturase